MVSGYVCLCRELTNVMHFRIGMTRRTYCGKISLSDNSIGWIQDNNHWDRRIIWVFFEDGVIIILGKDLGLCTSNNAINTVNLYFSQLIGIFVLI